MGNIMTNINFVVTKKEVLDCIIKQDNIDEYLNNLIMQDIKSKTSHEKKTMSRKELDDLMKNTNLWE